MVEAKGVLESKLKSKNEENEQLNTQMKKQEISFKQEMNRLENEKSQVCDQLTDIHFQFEEKKAESFAKEQDMKNAIAEGI